jgi:hypothetical protein
MQEYSGANCDDFGLILLVVSHGHLGISELGVLGSVRKSIRTIFVGSSWAVWCL